MLARRARAFLCSPGVYDRFVEAFVEKSQQLLKVGDPEDSATQVGAITMREQYDKIRAYCEVGILRGAKQLLVGGAG